MAQKLLCCSCLSLTRFTFHKLEIAGRCPLSIVIYSVWKECNLSHQLRAFPTGSTNNFFPLASVAKINKEATTGTVYIIILYYGWPELVAWPQGSEHNGALRYLDFINYHLNNKTRSGGCDNDARARRGIRNNENCRASCMSTRNLI